MFPMTPSLGLLAFRPGLDVEDGGRGDDDARHWECGLGRGWLALSRQDRAMIRRATVHSERSPVPPTSVAIVTAVDPTAGDSGKKVVLRGLLDYWTDRLGPESVHLVLVTDLAARPPALDVRVHCVPRPGTAEQLRSLAWRTGATGRHAIQESMLYGRRTERALEAVLGEIDAGLELFDTIRMAQYAERIRCRPGTTRVVYLDDLFSVRYERMLELLRARPEVALDPLGEFRSVVPRWLAPVADRRLAQRALLTAERRIVHRREIEAAYNFDTSLLVSSEEVGLLAKRAAGSNVHVLPPLVDVRSTAREYDGRPVFVLLGLLSLPHNSDATLAFLAGPMAELVRRMPDVLVRVIGRGASRDVETMAARFPGNVSVEGFVPDLDTVMSAATALVAPLRFGSGVKIKLLEALARGVPVLCTPVAAEGIVTGPRSGVLVEADLQRFPARMVELTDVSRNTEQSTWARRHHAVRYSRDAVYGMYDNVFGRDVGARPVAVSIPRVSD